MANEPQLPDGTRIFRHRDDGYEFEGPQYAGLHLEEIEAFLGGFLGEQAGVFHEIISDKVHLDILMFPPNEKRSNWTFVTSGMSDLPMNVPEDIEPRSDFELAELAIALPSDWFVRRPDGMIADEELSMPEKYWPIGLLKFIARLPHHFGSWVWESHTFVADGTPPEPYDSSTKMSGSILLPMIGWPEGKHLLTTSDGKKINFFSVVPLHADELTLKLNKGVEALANALDAAGVTDVLDAARPSSVRKNRFLGFLRK
jgi:hypothetical protein